MTTSGVKFYQVGSRAVGNRLLPEQERSEQASPDRANALNSGHRACQGCGEALAARYVLDAAVRATAGKLIVVNATGCLEVFSTPYPESSWQLPWMHSVFANAPAVASGIAAALATQDRSEVRVLAQGGDGATVDIGLGCLSGMFERDDDVLYVCYDNEAYMNTGVQRSGATPPAARTATTEVVGDELASYVGAAVRDLRGSICPEALPEMASRLAGYRLAELAVEQRPSDPAWIPLTTTHTKGGAR